MRQFLKFCTFFLLFFIVMSCTPFAVRNPPDSILKVVFISDSGQAVRAAYRDDDTVMLTFPDGRTEILNLAVSASGARFVAGKNEWWEHQGEATYSVNDELVFTGRLQRQPDH